MRVIEPETPCFGAYAVTGLLRHLLPGELTRIRTHFETITADLGKVDGTPPAPPSFAKANPASRMVFVGFDRAWGTEDLQVRAFHPTPAAQFVVYLQGTMSITVTDGETRHFGPGDVLRVEDTAPCKGHISVVGDRPSFTAISR